MTTTTTIIINESLLDHVADDSVSLARATVLIVYTIAVDTESAAAPA